MAAIPYHDFGGHGGPLLLAHANGYPLALTGVS